MLRSVRMLLCVSRVAKAMTLMMTVLDGLVQRQLDPGVSGRGRRPGPLQCLEAEREVVRARHLQFGFPVQVLEGGVAGKNKDSELFVCGK